MLSPLSKVEVALMEHLSRGPERVTVLVERISRTQRVTPEAAYLALRNLRKKRIAVSTKGVASLYIFWIEELKNFADQVKRSYQKAYTDMLLFRDIKSPKFHKKTIRCSHFDALENTFHHMAQSFLEPQKSKTPYFFFGFAPWWMTLCPKDADSFIKLITSYNYQPLMVFSTHYPIDTKTLRRLKLLGVQIVFAGPQDMPFGFEGHYVNGIFLEVAYPKQKYLRFHKVYKDAKAEDIQKIDAIMRTLAPTKIRVSKKKVPFKKSVLDQFAVSKSFFQAL